MDDPGEIRKRSVTVAGHRTSLSLEPAFWDELKRQAAAEGLSINALVERIDRARPAGGTGGNLSSAVRVHLLGRLRAAAGLAERESGEAAGASGPGP